MDWSWRYIGAIFQFQAACKIWEVIFSSDNLYVNAIRHISMVCPSSSTRTPSLPLRRPEITLQFMSRVAEQKKMDIKAGQLPQCLNQHTKSVHSIAQS
jgi:hypothetical protein